MRKAWAAGERGPSLRALVGTMLVGWGLFNLVEGVVDHHLIGVHNVRDDVSDPLWWNVGFLVFGAVLVAVGAVLARSARPPPAPRSAAPS